MVVSDRQRDRWRRSWDRGAASYDPPMRLLDRVLFRDTREWLCRRATGDVLEIAVGTGLNLPHYPPAIRLVGIDLSMPMLAIAERRAAELGRTVQLRVGDAEDLDVPDGSADTVVCTFSLCGIPDHHRAVAEMARVLRPGGRLLLAEITSPAATDSCEGCSGWPRWCPCRRPGSTSGADHCTRWRPPGLR